MRACPAAEADAKTIRVGQTGRAPPPLHLLRATLEGGAEVAKGEFPSGVSGTLSHGKARAHRPRIQKGRERVRYQWGSDAEGGGGRATHVLHKSVKGSRVAAMWSMRGSRVANILDLGDFWDLLIWGESWKTE